MAKNPNSPDGDSDPAVDLGAALQFYKQLADGYIIRGIKLSVAGFDGSVIVVVGAGEFYAIAPDDILFEEASDARSPRNIWVKKGAAAWRCQKSVLDGPGVGAVTSQDLSSLHSDLSARIQDLSSHSSLLGGRIAALAATIASARTAAPAVGAQLAGSVLRGRPLPARPTIKHAVLQAAAFPTQSPQADSIDEAVSISSLRQGIDPIEDLAKICMFTKPFSDDGLLIDYASVESMGTTLGGFMDYIVYCYRHPR